MAQTRVNCPECDAVVRVEASVKPGAKIRCPSCDAVFRNRTDDYEDDAPRSKQRIKNRDDVPRAKVVTSARRRRRDEDDDDDRDETGNSKLWLWVGLGGGGGILVLAAAVAIVIAIIASRKDSSSVAQASSSRTGSDHVQPSSSSEKRISPPPFSSGFPGGGSSRPIQIAKSVIDDEPFDGPLPELPNLPPPGQRPMLVLDARSHTDGVRRVFFNPDATQLISISNDKTIRLWDLEADESIKVIRTPIGPGITGMLNAAALSPDGKLLAVGGMILGAGDRGLMVYVISLESEKIVKVLKGQTQPQSAMAFSADGKWLASGGADNLVLIRGLEDDKTIKLEGHTDTVRDVKFHPDGTQVATASSDKTACIWWPADGKKKVLQGHTMGCISCAWSHDGKSLATGSVDGTVRIYTRDGDLVKTVTAEEIGGGGNTQVTSLSFTPNDKELLYTGIARTGEAGMIDVASSKRRLRFQGHNNTVIHGSLSRDGKLAVSTGGDSNEILVWRTDNGKLLHQFTSAGKGIYGVGWSDDGKTIGWGNINRGSSVLGAPPVLERYFRLDYFDFDRPPTKVVRDLLELDGYKLERPDFFKVVVKKDGQPLFVLDTSKEDWRVDSMCMLTGGRAVLGTSQGLHLLDLKAQKVTRHFAAITGQTFGIAPSPNFRYFVSGGGDQILHIWSPDRDDPILSIFVAGWDWIAWTPEGYYSCSGNGERLMGWLTNNGRDALASFAPASQFRGSMYEPEIVQRMLRAGNLPKAMALVSRDFKKTIPPLVLTDVLPPRVAIVSPQFGPQGDVKLNGDTIELKATGTSQGRYPVKSMRLLVDGRPYQGKAGVRTIASPKPGAVDASWPIKLSPGTHDIAVQADCGVSKGVSSSVRVIVPGAGGDNSKPNLYMVAAGISEYPGKLRLHYAASDAGRIVKAFKEYCAGSFGKIECHLVQDKDATKARILQELDWLASKMTPNDVGIVFFSGHGARDDDGNFFMIPVDVSRRDLAGSSVSGEQVRDRMENMSGRLVLMMDCCHSGTVAEDLAISRADNLMRDLTSDDCGVIVLCSSLGSEYSMESTQTQAGYFTLGIVEGLAGKADLNEDKKIYLHELLYYAAWEVQRLSRGEQNPIGSKPPGIRSFALATVR